MSIAYTQFAKYYDRLGWSEFSEMVHPLLEKFFLSIDKPPTTFLDLACGTGVLACRLADQGLAVTGVDISPQMIEVAKSKISHNGHRPRFVVADICSLDLGSTYEMVGCFFDSINHLKSREAIKESFFAAARHLVDGGWFVFDMVTEQGLETWPPYHNSEEDKYYVHQQAIYVPNKGYAQVEIEAFIKDDQNETVHIKEVFNEISIPLELAHEYLRQAGFSKIIIKAIGPTRKLEAAERVMVHAKK